MKLRIGRASHVATFGTALDITLAELSIESFFPADAETAAVFQNRQTTGILANQARG